MSTPIKINGQKPPVTIVTESAPNALKMRGKAETKPPTTAAKVEPVPVAKKEPGYDYEKAQKLKEEEELNNAVRQLLKFPPISKVDIFNVALPAAEKDWFGVIEPTNSPSYLRIYVCVSASGILRVSRKVANTTVTENLNGGTALTADAAYIFTIEWRKGDEVKLRYSVTSGTIKVLRMDEIGAGE